MEEIEEIARVRSIIKRHLSSASNDGNGQGESPPFQTRAFAYLIIFGHRHWWRCGQDISLHIMP